MAEKRKRGRPKGSTTRPQIREYMTPQEIEDLIVDVIQRAKKSDKLAIWLGNQIFGKPVQPIGNDGDKPFKIEGIEITLRK